jgi:Yip1-like protein
MASFVNRMIGAAKLDVATYEEVKADPKATIQAIVVVLLSAAAAGIGQMVSITGFSSGQIVQMRHIASGFNMILTYALCAWIAWAFLMWLIGAIFLAEADTHAGVGPFMRTIGFAAGPGIISVLGGVPLLGGLLSNVAWIWMLAATVVAVRRALNYKGTGRAILVCTIAGIVPFYVSYTALVILHGGL